MGRHLKVVERGFARKNTHELTKLLKSLEKESQEAVETLIALMKSTEVSDKIKLEAACKLLDMQKEVAESINTDELQRTIANFKFGGPRQLEEEDDVPEISFDIVQN